MRKVWRGGHAEKEKGEEGGEMWKRVGRDGVCVRGGS